MFYFVRFIVSNMILNRYNMNKEKIFLKNIKFMCI